MRAVELYKPRNFLHIDTFRALELEKCVCAETNFMLPKDLGDTLQCYLCVHDKHPSPPRTLLVGYNITQILQVLHGRGVDLFQLAPIVAIIDMESISEYLFGSS
jgi:hypothetical protein